MMTVYKIIKRVGDIFGSLVALIIFSPVTIVIAIMIKKEDGGPILFKQQRVGRNGRLFEMWKFRSMVVNAHSLKMELLEMKEAGGPTFKIKNDPRVTKIGRFIRQHSLDEIPQFVNVFLGDMSLVGPRPGLPEEVAAYSPKDARRLIILPGLTGLWQVSGRNNLSYQQMIKLDLWYVENRNVFLDVKILFKTFIQMFNTKDNGAF